MSEKTKVISTHNAEHYKWGENCDGWHLAKSENLSVIQELVPSGCSEIKHYHVKSEQFFYVLSGIASIEIDGYTLDIKSGHGIHIKPGISHKLSNNQTESLSFIVVSTPPSHGDRVIA